VTVIRGKESVVVQGTQTEKYATGIKAIGPDGGEM
jgi:hypothetical protein